MKKLGLISSLATIGILFMALLLLGSCTKKEAPSAPANLKAVINGDCIQLSWNKVPHADYYRITVGFQIRDSYNCLLEETYEVFLCETTDHTYNDFYPFEKMNYYKIEAVNEYGSSPCSEVSCDYPYHGGGLLFSLYPIPSMDYLCIQSGNIDRVTMTNLSGDIFLEREIHLGSNSFDLSLDPGIYLVHAYNENGEAVNRFVIKGE